MSTRVDLEELRIDHQDREVPAAPRSNPWKWLFFLLLLAGAAGWFFLGERRGDQAPPGVPVATERIGTGGSRGPAVFSATGWIAVPNDQPVRVSPLVTGRLDELKVVEGDRVTRDQVIARLYAQDYRDERAAAQAALARAQAELDRLLAGYRPQEVAQAQAEVESLVAADRVARATLERSRRLQPRGALSRERLQEDEAAAADAGGRLRAAQERLSLLAEGYRTEEIAAARARVAQARAEAELAAARLAYTEVRAPMTGVVLQRLARAGQWLERGTGLVDLYDPADLEARIDVNQEDLPSLFLGQPVKLTTRAEQERSFRARVILLEPQADRVKNILQVKVKIAEPAAGILYPGMVVQARFHPPAPKGDAGRDTPSLPTLPAAALLRRDGETFVYLVEEGRARRRRVTVGKIDAGRYPVRRGLARGELVITGETEFLAEGTRVRPRQEER